MAAIPGSAGDSRVHRLFASRASLPATTVRAPVAENRQASPQQPWLTELSAPVPLARWASAFSDLRSCWNACRDPEWLLWLAARSYDSAEQRKRVVLCAAELASMAQRGGRETDPRVTRAISMVQLWAESGADDLDLLAAQCDALDAARETALVADREADRALALFRTAPRRRPSSSGMSRALGALQGWREKERDRCLALAAASAAGATVLPDDAVAATEWADCVSQSAAYALQAMSTHRRPGARPSWLVMQRTRRFARRRLACPEQGPTPAEWQRSALDDENAGAGLGEAGQDGGADGREADDVGPDVLDGDERVPVAVQPQGQVEVVEGGDTEAEAALPQGDQHTATDDAETGENADQDTAEQASE
jgi:hypothetical protein